MKTFFLLFLFTFVILDVFSQKYFSYPDRNIEIQLKDTILIWKDHKSYGGIKTADKIFHFYYKGDTLVIREKTIYGNKSQIAIKKGNYLDLINVIEGDSGCGMLFRRNSLYFKYKSKRIMKNTSRTTYNRMIHLHSRLKRLEIFGRGCNNPLPPLIYEHF